MKFRIGAVPYGVGSPLVTGLDRDPAVDAIEDIPSELIVRLRAGELDAALVSSIEAFRRTGYRALADIGICCLGPVHSVRAFRRRGREVRTVGLDTASETSAALLKILMPQIAPGCDPTFERVESTIRPDDLPHDLVMLIGDAGLRADPGEREVIDLCDEWTEMTGLPFVFALWLIAPGAPSDEIAALLRAARERGRPGDRADGTGGAVHYDITPRERDGLRRFHIEAAALGLADPAIEPTFVDRATPHVANTTAADR